MADWDGDGIRATLIERKRRNRRVFRVELIMMEKLDLEDSGRRRWREEYKMFIEKGRVKMKMEDSVIS